MEKIKKFVKEGVKRDLPGNLPDFVNGCVFRVCYVHHHNHFI